VKDDLPAVPMHDLQMPKTDRAVNGARLLSGHAGRQRRQVLQAVLLALVAAGLLWEDVLVVRLLDFPVTPTILLTAGLFILGAGMWTGPGYRVNRLFYPAFALFLYELIVHGVLGGGASNPQWIRSFALLTLCVGLVMVLSRLQVREQQLPAIAKWVSWCAYLMGGLGIAQFLASNAFGYLWTFLPDRLAVHGTPELDTDRFAGLFRAQGISSEPSYYGLGMVMLTALCLAFLSLAPPDRKSSLFRYGALLIAIGGVVVSASFSALGVLAVVLLVYAATHRVFVLKHKAVVLASVALIIAAVVFLRPFLEDRLLDVLGDQDMSTDYRLRAAVDLVFAPADDLPSALLGTGVGMDAGSPTIWRAFERYIPPEYLNYLLEDRSQLDLATGWAYVAVTMGWIGLALNGWLVVAAFQGQSRLSFPTLALLALSVAYLLAVGTYLLPEWWAWLALVAVLRSARAR
jgi:hypothetical protein